MAEMARYPHHFEQVLLHTGQHYDDSMSSFFFRDLDMPEPHEVLNVGSGAHAEQTAKIMLTFEPVVLKRRPELVLVVGDVNSTLACALVCAKLCIPVAHVEAGLRSFDRTMPEEVNRLLTDQIADILFTPSLDANRHLLREGIAPSKIHFVGNVMIDSLVRWLPKAEQRRPLMELGLPQREYVLVTLHRPSNVDNADTFAEILSALQSIGQDVLVVFPLHPRTRQRIESYRLQIDHRVCFSAPLGYLDFLSLEKNASLVITDSGGVQEETTYLGVPCLTLRPNTERPVTIEIGTNQLVALNQNDIVRAARERLSQRARACSIPELWDGHTARRIVEKLLTW